MKQKEYLFSNKDLYKLILPLVVEQLLTVAVGMADSIMVASVGEAAVSAVSLVDTVNILIINIFTAFATGGAIVAGQALGRKNKEQACKSADQLLIFCTLSAIVIMIFVYLIKNFILTFVFGHIEPDVYNYCNTYIMIVSLSIPFIAIYNCGAALFRSMGNSKTPMITSTIMNAVNIIGNAILIYGLHMKIEGAAIPTLISRIVASVIIIGLLKNESLTIHLSKPFNLKPNWKIISKILHIGVPNGIENSMFQLGKIFVLNLVAGFGTSAIAANAVGNAIATFQVLPGLATSYAVVTVVSVCVGAADYIQARYYTKKIMKYTYIISFFSNTFIFIILPFILKAYKLSSQTYNMAQEILWLHGICCLLIWPFSFVLPNTLRAANDVKFSMIVGMLSMWICRIAFSFVLGKYCKLGLLGVWIAMILDWCCRSIFFIYRYRGNKWQIYS